MKPILNRGIGKRLQGKEWQGGALKGAERHRNEAM